MDGGIRREWVHKSCPRTRGMSPRVKERPRTREVSSTKTSDQMTRPLRDRVVAGLGLEGGALVLAVGGPGVADEVLMPPRRYCKGPGATNWGLGAGQ